MTKSKLVKSGVFILLLIAASCFFSYRCQQIGQLSDAIFSPSLDTLYPFLWLLLAIALVAITAGLVAALVRPLWVCFVAFALSGLAVLLILGLNLLSLVLAVLYFLAGVIYSQGTAKGLNERIKFSVRPIQDNQMILLIVLVIAACAMFYSGYAAKIEREGFTPPAFVIDIATGIVENQIQAEPGLSPQEKEQAMAQFRQELEQQMADWIKPYQQYIPAGIALSLLGILITIIQFLSWLPVQFVRGIFAALTACHVLVMVTETQEVKRLTMG
jgi:hypothetical protein